MRIKMNELVKEKNELINANISSKYNELVEQKKKEIYLLNSNTNLIVPAIELIFFFDKSGSVSGTEKQMSDHLKNIIEKYKNSKQNILITLILFSDEDTILYYRCPIANIKNIYYSTEGGTSLFDSLTKNIRNIIEDQINHNDVASKTIVTIMTDGEDTTSHIHKESDVEKLVNYTKKQGWEYIYLTPFQYDKPYLGIDLNHIGSYNKKDSLAKMFKAIEKAVDEYIETNSISENWKKPLSSDKILRLENKRK